MASEAVCLRSPSVVIIRFVLPTPNAAVDRTDVSDFHLVAWDEVKLNLTFAVASKDAKWCPESKLKPYSATTLFPIADEIVAMS